MSGILGLVVAILLTVGMVWLAFRAWRARNVAVRVVAGIGTSLLLILPAAVSVLGIAGAYDLYAPHGAPASNVTAQVSPDVLAAASKRMNGCTGCHSSTGDLPLDGGDANLLAGGPPLGVLVPPNLTAGGPLKDWSDGEIIRAIREGVDRDGHPLLIMPSDTFHHLSDSDVQAVVAYLRSQPAVNHSTPPRDISLLGLVIVGAGLFPTAEQPHIDQPQAAPPPGVTPEYGQYLVDITGCRTCHGPALEGRAPGGFGPPAGPNLKALVPTWQESAFINFFRTGVDAYGRAVDPALMPWQDIGKAYSDDELRAIHTYIRAAQ
jgi:mono/diheme cytochrome c family protein